MATCPNKNLRAWQDLELAQPDRAYYLWDKYGGYVPNHFYNKASVKNAVKKELKFRSPLSNNALILLKKRIGEYNANNGTSHSFTKPEQIGESDNYRVQLVLNYQPVNEAAKAERNARRGVEDKVFSDVEEFVKIKEVVDFIFEQNLELSKIGTPEQYSAYLDTIFPNSKVTNELFVHKGNIVKEFNKDKNIKFDKSKITGYSTSKGFYFDAISDLEFIKNKDKTYVNESWMTFPNSVTLEDFIFVKLNIKNPWYPMGANPNLSKPWTKEDRERSNKLKEFSDSVMQSENYLSNLAVWEPEQIHILGSKQDIEGFKEFVSRKEVGEVINTDLANKLSELFPEIKINFGIMEGIAGQANIEALSVLLNPEELTEDTLPHEYAHHYIAWFRDTELVKEAVKKYGSEEALVQAIGEQIVEQKGEAYGWWKKFSKWIQALFNTISSKSKEELRNILTDAMLTRQDLGGKGFEYAIQNRGIGTYNQTKTSQANTEGSKKKLNGVKVALENTLDKVQKRLNILKLQGDKKEDLVKKQQELLDNLTKMYEDGTYLLGIERYLSESLKTFSGIQDKLKSLYEGNPSGSTIKDMGNFISSHQNILEEISRGLYKESFKTQEAKEKAAILNAEVAHLQRITENLKDDYLELARNHLAVFLKQFGWNHSVGDLKKVLETPVKDISTTQTWLDAMNVADDEVLRLIAKAVEDTKELARLENVEIQQKLIRLKKDLEKGGIKNTKWMANTINGKYTGDFVTERDWGTFYTEQTALYNKLKTKYGVPYSKREGLPETKQKEYEAEVSNFYSKVLLSQREANDLIKAQQAKLSTEEFDRWMALNVEVNTDNGNYKIPRNKDSKFDEIKNNPLKLKYYNAIIDLKVEMEKFFPEKFKHPRRMPQIRKDSIERIKQGNIKSILNDMQESYKVMEDESKRGTDFGILDERDNVVNFLPIYFTNRIKDMENLSLDVTSTMLAFSNMATDRKHMLKIINSIELASDVLIDRGVVKTSNKGNVLTTFKKFAGFKEEIPIKDKSPGNIFKRYTEYMNMTVYGKMQVGGKSILGADSEKILNTIGGYTAVTQLAINIFAGINNVNVGKAMLRIESASKEFFSYPDLLYADKIYASELPKTMANIGNRLSNSKMDIWTLTHNTLENYSEEIANLDTERKTIFGRLFKMSALFFITKAGEHYIHSKASIALANQFRYSKKEGHFVTKKQFFAPLADLKDEQRSEIESIDVKNLKENGKKVSDAVKDIKAKYADKIKALDSKLKEEWKGMTNYWEAHDVKDNLLTLKPEFRNKHEKKDHLTFINLQNSINRALHGNYGPYAAALQKYALGRLALMFRKWMKPSWNRRFQKHYEDFQKGSEVEGYYRTVGKFVAQLRRDLIDKQLSIYKNWNALSDHEKANFNRAMAEVSYLLAAATLAVIIVNLKGDDDDDWWANMAAYQANRLFTEIGAMVPGPSMVTEGLRILQTPAAAISPIQGIINFMQFWNWGDEIERGKYKGMNKFERGAIKIIPLAKTITDYSYPEDKLTFYTFN